MVELWVPFSWHFLTLPIQLVKVWKSTYNVYIRGTPVDKNKTIGNIVFINPVKDRILSTNRLTNTLLKTHIVYCFFLIYVQLFTVKNVNKVPEKKNGYTSIVMVW